MKKCKMCGESMTVYTRQYRVYHRDRLIGRACCPRCAWDLARRVTRCQFAELPDDITIL
jgi:hypothetical protein